MHPIRNRFTAIAASAILSGSLVFAAGSPAVADTAPVNPADPLTPTTVTADELPTAQINGVAWTQVIIGNTVYVGGDFTSARPAGSPAGVNEVARGNILAYDLRTGQLINSFAPSFNAQVTALAASPDGSKLYVGGQFTSLNGATVWRLVALNPTTGALDRNFLPKPSASVRAIAATNDTVYYGGVFGAVGSVERLGLAAARVSDGALLDWAPKAEGGRVNALTLSPDRTKIAVGGAFTTLNGSNRPGYGLGVLDTATGTQFPLPANEYVRNGSSNGSITSLTSDGTNFYATGYTFGRFSTLEGTVSIKWSDLNTEWLEDCHGDSYSVYAGNADLVYIAGHPHHCANIGAFPQERTWEFRRGLAFSKKVGGTITRELYDYTNFEGMPRPELQHWYPDMNAGTITGQDQGPWSVTGSGDYIAMAGEFTIVNGRAQQGLVRYTTRENAPNSEGPRFSGSRIVPTLSSPEPGTVRVRWQANWDRDNENLTYRVVRNSNTANPVYTTTAESSFWWRPGMSFTDTGLVPGQEYRYRIYVTDPLGNQAVSDFATITVATESQPASTYAGTVTADQPSNYWRFGDGSGTIGLDRAGNDDLTLNTGVTLGAAGAVAGDGDTAATFSGSSTGTANITSRVQPADTFSTEAWFRTTTTRGGKIIGYGNWINGTADLMDRHLYMSNTGTLYFGVRQSGVRSTVNTTTRYNDGQWHHAVTTLGSNGMQLFVDGQLVASRADVTKGLDVLGYWKIGGDSMSSWGGRPTSSYFAGDIDEVAIYPSVLSAAQVQNHYVAGTTGAPMNVAPTASFTDTASDLQVSVDGSGSTDADGTIASYAWEFGDGGTATGATASHTYAEAGTYTVRLTVTDDDGEARSVTRDVTVTAAPPNQEPAASFTSSADGLAVSVDGSGSSDADGTIASYAWEFGDGGTATGATASHTYAAAGTYTVRLTVTDDDGATHSTTREATVEAGPLAADAFGRTVTGGWGSAETGGAWSRNGAASLFAVGNGAGTIRMNAAGAGPSAYLAGVSSTSSDVAVTVSLDKQPTGGGTFVSVAGRSTAAGQYRAKVKVAANGAVTLYTVKIVGNVETVLDSGVVSGLTYAAGDKLRVRIQVDGTSPTTVNAKVWRDGSAEPANWQETATDTTAGLQEAGGILLATYLAGTATNAPVVASFDDLTAIEVEKP
ncbi:hypothetical protein GCM10023081_32980 [Arthrobacter ginkgonis]|uniref:PKD domain-containing protein n=1 Tax=Arthrobacter ginkgonis TaxID=1630594 RepID=A0ABP7CQ12_9MICC